MISERRPEAVFRPRLLSWHFEVGALRTNVASDDPAYVAAMRDAFYGDVTVEHFGDWTANLHCDEPAAVGIRPSAATAERFGGVTRHYVANNRG